MTFRDAIHNDIVINDELILDLITTKEFQRLRKIKQLGLTSVVFPSSEHTRFSHSIGVYYVGRKTIETVLQKSNLSLTTEDVDAFLVACLLHDLGHGPLSHASESFFGFNHEDFSTRIIQDPSTQINQVIEKSNRVSVEAVVKIIQKKYPKKVLNKLLSSNIDVDRMDYLFRDSHHIGVVYGQYDYSRIVTEIKFTDDKVVFSIDSIRTVEDFLFGRYHMFSQVYLNGKSLVYEKVIALILGRIKVLLASGYEFKVDLRKLLPFYNLQENDISLEEYLQMNDFVFLNLVDDLYNQETDEELYKLCRVICEQRPVFKTRSSDKQKAIKIMINDKQLYNDKDPIYFMDKDEIITGDKCSNLLKYANEMLVVEQVEKEFYIDFD